MITIAILNQKGGAGKTTAAIHLASAAHLSGLRTLLLDCDPQGSASDWSNSRVAGSALDGLAVAQAPAAMRLPRYRELSRGHDVVVCDGPPRLGDVTRAIAVAADIVLIPLQPGGFDVWASVATIELLDSADEVRAQLGAKGARRVFVLSRVPTSRTKALLHVEDHLAAANVPLCPVVIHHRTAYAEVIPHGETALTMYPRSTAAAEIRALYDHLMQAPPAGDRS